ncbi:hypothetical protein DFQ27_003721 [Actinomortierella ambigua]|uniref:Mediator of RNA polymerase II transcription subunit 17 n=1 Tax=Actinomortierella ambigua TaxID=1343610 RepID=A0A9P6UCQ8_9FUNG|nr:hypothetical protein DFQ27_003721 [Actinomortierella ambigua]
MSSPPAEKRIRLNLERSSSRLPHDVTEKAEEIYMREGDPAEKLTCKITKIWETAAGKFDDFTEDLAAKVAIQEQEEAADNNKDGKDQAQQDGAAAKKRKFKARKETADADVAETRLVPRPGSTEAVDIRKEIYGRLWHAQGEIRIALDVLNIIISSYQNPGVGTSAGAGGVGGVGGPAAAAAASAAAGGVTGGAAGPGGPMSNSAANSQQILPPGTLRCEHTSNTTVEASIQIQKEKMAIGGKRLQFKVARDILMQGAQKLQSVVSSEDHFWSSALRLRKNNWCIVSTNPGGGPSGSGSLMHGHHHRHVPGSQLYVHYGFRDVGSTFPEQAYAEVVRVPSSGKSRQLNSIEVSIPNQTGKAVSFSLVRQGTPHTHHPSIKSEKRALVLGNKPKSIHAQLHDAQTSIFDAELFQEFINEARNLTYSVNIVDNEVFMPINDDLELKISYRADSSFSSTTHPTTETSDPSSSLSSSNTPTIPNDHSNPSSSSSSSSTKHLDRTAEILKCCMRLAQHKRHRQNIQDKRESFFKRSRPGAALAGASGVAGSAGGASGGASGAAGGAGVSAAGSGAAGSAGAGAGATGSGANAGAVGAGDGGVTIGGGGGGGTDVNMTTVTGNGAAGAGGGASGAASGGAGGAGGAGNSTASGGGGANAGGVGSGGGYHLASPMMLDATLHLLQYYSFARRIREVVDRVLRPFRIAWWEPLELHTWDMKKPPVAATAATAGGARSSSSSKLSMDEAAVQSRSAGKPTIPTTSTSPAAAAAAASASMGMAVSIRLGAHTPALRFVIRSHPTPCVVLQLADRPSWPIKHAAEFEQVLRQELAVRVVGRLCQVANAIEDWSRAEEDEEDDEDDERGGGGAEKKKKKSKVATTTTTALPPKWIVDIERQCVGVFKTASGPGKTTTKLAGPVDDLVLQQGRETTNDGRGTQDSVGNSLSGRAGR